VALGREDDVDLLPAPLRSDPVLLRDDPDVRAFLDDPILLRERESEKVEF
jgi:hypothetical protein